ncbi:MAG: TIGR01440 family protein [Oscillospiraceae bacterium]|nr:TIGR01440 family protein [Oscillospiraceae bacterium]
MKDVYEISDKALLESIKNEAIEAACALCDAAKLQRDDLFIVGCSSSEVLGEKIGTNSSLDVADAIFEGIYSVLKEKGILMAVQCCEHLNRAVILEKRAAVKLGYPIVNVLPQPKAGGSLGTLAFERLPDAVAVEKIRADAGIDIGLTMIGMHLKEVAVPVRLPIKKIGNATIVCARTRPKFVGGARACYNQDLL